MLHKYKTEIIKMKRNIGALQFYKKLKNKRCSLLLFHMEMAAYKMHAFMRRSYFLYFFSFLFYVVPGTQYFLGPRLFAQKKKI